MKKVLFFFFFLTFSFAIVAQYTITGFKGLVVVPEANILEDRDFFYGFSLNPERYKLVLPNVDGGGLELVNSVGIGFFPRLNITLNLTQKPDAERNGIGDRAAQLSYLLKKESSNLPAILIALDMPLGVQSHLASNFVVATKTILRTSPLHIKASLGYGVPYKYSRTPMEGGFFGEFGSARIRKKNSNYLNGVFFGVGLQLYERLGVSFEFDSFKFNSGIDFQLLNFLDVSFFSLGFNEIGVGVSLRGVIN